MFAPGALRAALLHHDEFAEGDNPHDSDTDFVVMYPNAQYWLLAEYSRPRAAHEPTAEQCIYRLHASMYPENRGEGRDYDAATRDYIAKVLRGEESIMYGPTPDGGYGFVRMPDEVNYQAVYWELGLTWFGMPVTVERMLPHKEEEVTTVSSFACVFIALHRLTSVW